MLTIGKLNLCDLCFAEVGKKAKSCPYCNGKKNIECYPISLKEGTVLAGRYCVGRILGKGGFGITYLAYDLKENKKVAIKEYMPVSLAYRNTGATAVTTLGGEKTKQFNDGAKKFFDEAKLVSCFNGNPNIISVYEFFDENNTTYFVMEYLSGMDMKDYLAKNGVRPEGELLYVVDKVTQALSVVHSMNTLHRDISPDNIFVCENGQIKLIDFGAARQVIADESNSLSVIIKHGFAPMEQYSGKGNQGPWTDIYALGASIYYGLTGKKADDANSRYDDPTLDLSGVSPEFARIIEKMMAVDIKDRYQNVLELRADLTALSITPIMPVIKSPEPKKPNEKDDIENNPESESISGSESRLQTKKKASGKKWIIPVIAAVVCLALVITLIPVISSNSNKPSSDLEEPPPTAEVGEEASSSKFGVLPESEKEDLFASSDLAEDSTPEQNSTSSDVASSKPHSHSFTTSKVTKKATTTSTGVKTYYCSCGATKTETIAKLKGVDWKFSNGTLTISGKGQMDDYDIGSKNESTAPWMKHQKSITKVVVESGITSIGNYAFRCCEKLTSITIPDSVTSIGYEAFYKCTSLTSITIPDSVTSIGEDAFSYCESLTSITIPNSVKSIGVSVFRYCEGLTSITIEAGVTSIGNEAFYSCSGLTNITIPSSVKSIGKDAFTWCNSLTSITIPNSVTSIGDGVFSCCESLKSITIPNSIKSIGSYAFCRCTSLTSITIPSSVTSIGNYAFSYCFRLKTLTIQNSKGNVKIASDAFSDCPSSLKIIYTK